MSLSKARFLAVAPIFALAACSSTSAGTPPGPTADTRAQALAYAKDDLPCTADADCCAVFDGCRAQAYVVAAKDQPVVTDLLAKASMDMCVGCIAPSAQVSCSAGKCTGVLAAPGMGAAFEDGADFRQNHCGKLPLPQGWTAPQSAPIGATLEKVLGCGT